LYIVNLNREIAIVILLTAFSVIASAQTQYGVRKIYAFSMMQMPGNIPVDENRKPVVRHREPLNFIYAETSGRPIAWDRAWKNGITYHIDTSEITSFPFDAAEKNGSREHVLIKPARGNRLWELRLSATEKNQPPPQKIKTGQMLLRGKYGKTIFYRIISSQRMLEGYPVY
jgi:hypothetical protein